MGFFSSKSSTSTTSNLTQQDQKQAAGDGAINANLAGARDSTFTFENLDADFGKLAFDFAGSALNKTFQSLQQQSSSAINALEDTRKLSASLLEKASSTPDDRIQKITSMTVAAVVALAAFFIWRVK